MNNDEIKEELTKRMAEAHSDYIEDPVGGEYADGYASGCEYAIELLENLQEKKVVIPEFIANNIKYHKKHGSTLRGALGSAFNQDVEKNVYYWFFAADGDENVRKYISAWDNGYKVDKPRRVVKLKGIHGARKYVRLNDEGKVILGFKGNDGITGGALTAEETKEKWPEFETYNHAGLLEFEEAENHE
ncbi:DUF1642 domain-containing protein [Pediococcus acidilactici]|uniref:DUF1642 domain-containing protein n=1 Tax=Pediococcus acidilactici TaxID=1254 RepID=UPI003A8F75A1